jgi:predicted PolB exonuclease-like 3'-5' exonuclease
MSTALQSKQQTPQIVRADPAYLIFDTESVPDGRLIADVKYSGESLTPEAAIDRFQGELREKSFAGSDFVPVMYQYPVALCIVRVGADFSLQKITRLGEPQFEPRKIVEQFWSGYSVTKSRLRDKIRLVTFNGRSFDLPLMETAAFRYGLSAREYFQTRNRYNGDHIDVLEFLTNFGAVRGSHCQDALAKLLGLPGKMDVAGHQVYGLYRDGKIGDIVDYCLCDTLDLYFIFLRTRVMTGELTLEQEHRLTRAARELLESMVEQLPVLKQYLDLWKGWNPRP